MTEIKNGDTVVVDLDTPQSSWHKAEGVLLEEPLPCGSARKVRITKSSDKDPEFPVVGKEYRLVNLTKAPGFRVGTKAVFTGTCYSFAGKEVTVTEAVMSGLYGLYDYIVRHNGVGGYPVFHHELQRLPEAPKATPKSGNPFKVGDKVRTVGYGSEIWNNRPGVVSALGLNGGSTVVIDFSDGEYLSSGGFDFKYVELAAPTWAEVKVEAVDGPAHYGGKDNPYEAIKVAEAWGFNKEAYLFNALKYLARAGKKGDKVEDLKKLKFYVDREIALEEAK